MAEYSNMDVCPIPLPPRCAPSNTLSRLPPTLNSPVPPEKPSSSSSAHCSRKLQIVLIIDQKAAKNLRVREMACNDVQKVADSLNVNLTRLDFDRLDFGETNALDVFYNADVALVDVSITQQQPSLCYHIGVRESMGQSYNIILTHFTDETSELLVKALRKTLAHLPMIVYILPNDNSSLVSVDKSSKIDNIAQLKADIEQISEKIQPHLKGGRLISFRSRMKQALKSVQIEASAHSREKFLSDLRKARETEDVAEANRFLDKMRHRLDNPDVLSVDTLYQFMLSYRDNQNYDAMISLIDDLSRIENCCIVNAQAVRFLYAFALNRRNKEGDRDRALETVLQIISDNTDGTISPDVVCLAGRIYKDKFINSNYEDRESLDKAIEWYRKAFELSPLEYSGINLTTLLRARGETFENNSEMQQIAVVLNSLLGRKGALTNLSEYWDVATYFEVSVLAEDYPKACQAALKMAILKPPIWFLKSTMENIKLINRCAATMSPIEKEKQQFLFWSEFFMEAIDSESEIVCARFPVYTPSFLTMNLSEGSIILSHVLENSQQKKPPPGEDSPSPDPILNSSMLAILLANCYKLLYHRKSCQGIHRWHFTAANIKAVSASKRDDRSMFLYVHENSDDFNLVFPSAAHCNKVMASLIEMTSELDGNAGRVLHDCESENRLEFEYELNNNGDRVVLGRGTYGVVYSGRDLTTQSRFNRLSDHECCHAPITVVVSSKNMFFDDSISHPSQFLRFRRDFRFGSLISICFDSEVISSLSSLLRSKWGPLLDNEQTMAIYGKQILDGLRYLHEQKIVHRDIKGDNVLVNTYSGVCKISDFGTCKRLAGLNPVTETFTGTLQYMAPEVIDHGQRGYGAPADIWSFGCTMVEMATGRPPFVELGSPQAAMFKVGMFKAHPPIPERLSERCKRFILRCFEADPQKRATAAELLADPFIQQYVPHSNRSGSANKKHFEALKHNREMHRSSSHLGGIGISSAAATIGGDSAAKEHESAPKNLHLLIESATTPRSSSAGAFVIDHSSMSPNVSAFQLSQPSSPIIDDNTHPQLMSTPSVGSPSTMNGGLHSLSSYVSSLNRTSSDESGMSSRFFMLKKDSERRNTLARFMQEYKAEIIDHWFEHLAKSQQTNELLVTKEMLLTLLLGMRNYLLTKDTASIQEAIDTIRAQLDYEPTAISQVNLALYSFSDAVQPSLRQQSIKPHWIFALDNLIRSTVQAAVGILSPDLSAMLSVQDVPGNRMSSVSRDSGGSHSEHSTVDSRSCSAPHGTTRESMWGNLSPEMRKELKSLFEELVCVEREYKELLQSTLKEKRIRVERLTDFLSESGAGAAFGGGHAPPSPILPSFQLGSSSMNPNLRSVPPSSLRMPPNSPPNELHSPLGSPDATILRNDDLAQWLRSLNCDQATIRRLQEEEYTKSDLIDFVTREELLKLGLKGGVVCRIWRSITVQRERQQRLSAGYLSPSLRSRHNSTDDFHSTVNDELYTVSELATM
ncbi:Mitogen-activated protein kinase kinase kinase 15 [Toxocara canis]|uniref:mitogen-activated protein kinase kinase kinase n=1 Tax=Toxocara canis TaxID=6265 RepID=A0A0B2VCH8_TOXCA|nr:Mitogen-activated protein kinase kinase kinase 15 [Toxocara canis]